MPSVFKRLKKELSHYYKEPCSTQTVMFLQLVRKKFIYQPNISVNNDT